MVVKEWLSLLTSMFLVDIRVVSAVFLLRAVEYTRLHHHRPPAAVSTAATAPGTLLHNRLTVEALAIDRLRHAASVAVRGEPALMRQSRVLSRTPGPAAHIERGEIHGFASSSGPLLRGLSGWGSRPGPRQLVDGLSASGAQALRVRGLRLHVREGVDRGAAFRSAALSARCEQEAADRSSARRVSGAPSAMGWDVAS